MKRPTKRSEAGFSLITAVLIITLLVFLGSMVLNQAANDVWLAGGDRAASNALYIAEAGAVWGKANLTTMLYGASGTASSPNITTVEALTPLSSGDALCPDVPSACASYYQLAGTTNYGTGTYRVGVTCNPNCAGSPTSYIVRSLGQTPDGAQRLVEVTVGY